MTTEDLPALPEPFLEMYREVTPHVYNAWAEQARAIQRTAYEAGKRSAQQMAEALERTVKSAEQAAWEAWAASVNPSGDVESVQRQWERSIDFAEFCGAWSLQLDALRAYREQTK